MLTTCKSSTKWTLLFFMILFIALASNGNSTAVNTLTLPSLTPPSTVGNQNSSNYFYKLFSLSAEDALFKENVQLQLKDHSAINMDRDEKINLTTITWAHAVNSQKELIDVLNSDIDMIEADIVLGKLNNNGPDLPVMAHPPANTSDISLAEFLNQIMVHNNAHNEAKKGVKLDFKSIEVFEGSLDILNENIPLMSYPIWLNADIVRGPVNQSSTVPVDPERFFAGCAQFEEAVLSIGWTTRWGADFRTGEYTPEEIFNMLQAIQSNNVTATHQPITFPVRAGIAANSIEQLHDLVRAVNETNESSITIWSSQNDYVDVNKLRQLIYSFGFDRVFLDVPDELASKLDLGNTGGGAEATTFPSFLGFSLIGACMVLASMWLQRTRL